MNETHSPRMSPRASRVPQHHTSYITQAPAMQAMKANTVEPPVSGHCWDQILVSTKDRYLPLMRG